jgi:hypothetical protein
MEPVDLLMAGYTHARLRSAPIANSNPKRGRFGGESLTDSRFRAVGLGKACRPGSGDNGIRHLGDAVFIVATV